MEGLQDFHQGQGRQTHLVESLFVPVSVETVGHEQHLFVYFPVAGEVHGPLTTGGLPLGLKILFHFAGVQNAGGFYGDPVTNTGPVVGLPAIFSLLHIGCALNLRPQSRALVSAECSSLSGGAQLDPSNRTPHN